MKRILVITLFLFLLTCGGKAWATSPQCMGLPQYYTCSQLTGQAAGPPDSITDIGPLLTCQIITPTCQSQKYQGEQCRVTWSSPPYTWIAWAMPGTPGGTDCSQFSSSYLGIYTYWGANMPTHTGIAPAAGTGIP